MSAINGKNNRSDQFAAGHEFEVRFDKVQISFAKITNIGGKIETDSFIEGGNNVFPVTTIKAKQQPETIVFERGVSVEKEMNESRKFREGMVIPNMLIMVKKDGKLIKAYGIDRGMIISRKFSDLDGASSSIFIEKLEFSHTGLLDVKLS